MSPVRKYLPKRGSTQDGLASIVIVTVLVVLITLITIGFARIMTRTSNNALNDQLSTAATYAVQSGVNDVIGYLKNNPAASATKCNDLIGSDAAPGPLFDLSNLSGDEGRTTEYTCVLINQTPTDLAYQQLPPSKSQVAKLTTSGPADKLMVSWQSTDRSKNQLPAPSANPSLLDVSQWNDSDHMYAPVLRLSLYPIPSDGQVSGVQAVSKTFFLYPTSGGGNVTAIPYSTADGTLQNVNCGTKNAVGFTGTADYDCNIIISNLGTAASPSALGYFYARLTPIYSQADVKVKAENAAADPLQFTNTQAIVDVTARSSATAKRLQVRVDTNTSGGTSVNIGPTEETIPEYALRTAVSVCKRLIVGSPSAIDSAFCNLSIGPPPPPAANTGSATNITTNSATLNGTVNPQGYNVTTCRFEYGTTQSYGSSVNCSALPGAGRGDVAVSANIGSLAGATGYHFRLVAINANGQGQGDPVTFTTLTPPPSFSFSADNSSLNYNDSTTLRWTTNYTTWCWGSDAWSGWKNSGGGTESTGSLTSSQTYTLKCGRTGIEAPAQTVRINVASQPPPTPPSINKWEWTSGNRFVYNVSNANRCIIDPDGDTPGQEFGPVLNTDFPYFYGPASTGAWLRCYNQNVGPAEKYARVNISISVTITNPPPNQWTTPSNSPCRGDDGGVHPYLLCISYYATQSDGQPISPSQPCYIYWNGGGGNSSKGPLEQNAANKSLGLYTRTTGYGYVTVVCTSYKYNVSGSDQKPVPAYNSCLIYPDGTCPQTPLPPPPPPQPTPPPPPPPPYVEFQDCHNGRIYRHWSDGRHERTGNICFE